MVVTPGGLDGMMQLAPSRGVQVGQQLLEASLGCLVPFDLSGPTSLFGVGDELVFGFEARSDAGRVVAGGDELGAGEHEVAFARPFGGEAQAVPDSSSVFRKLVWSQWTAWLSSLPVSRVSAAGPAMRVPCDSASSY